jgi:RNA polymerase sigma-70 factor (ECF subfamily)
MDERDWLTERFEQHRPHLRAVAYRMLGSVSETDDALQEAWLRIRDQDPAAVDNLQAWLTTVVGRVCLNMLRSRSMRREERSVHVPDPVVSLEEDGPEHEALLAESVGLALLVMLEALTPAEATRVCAARRVRRAVRRHRLRARPLRSGRPAARQSRSPPGARLPGTGL